MFDGAQFGEAVVEAVKSYFDRKTAEITQRLGVLEARAPIPGADGLNGKDGEPGRDGAPGADGRDGADVTPDMVARALSDWLVNHPVIDGKDGADGVDGKDATPEMVREAVDAWFAANPPAAGKDGRDGADGRDGSDGLNGKDGADGRDGVGLAGGVITREGELVLTLTDGQVRDLGRVVGRDGVDGRDGADGKGIDGKDGERGLPGFSLEDFDSEVKDGGRTLVLSFTAGEIKHTVEHQLDTVVYRRVYKDGAEYQPGDMVSYGGGLWHCDTATTARPGEESNDWTLAVRRGREGKSVSIEDVNAKIDARMKEIEEILSTRLQMALDRKKV